MIILLMMISYDDDDDLLIAWKLKYYFTDFNLLIYSDKITYFSHVIS